MKKFISLFICFSFILVFPVSVMAEQIQVKSGLNIPLVFTEYKTSKNTISGEKIKAVIENDVKINDIVIFKKNDNAVLYAVDTKKAGFVGIPGQISLINGKVTDINGIQRNIEYTQRIEGQEKNYPKILLGVSIFMLFPLALFGFVKGGEAELSQQIPINVRLNEDFKYEPIRKI